MSLLLAAVAVTVSLLITPGWLFYFDVTPKLAALLIGTASVVQLLAGSKIGPVEDSVGPAWPRPLRWFAAILLLQLVVLIVSASTSAEPRLSLTGTIWRRFGAITQIAVLLFALGVSVALTGRPERRRFLLQATVLGGIVAAAYGTSQYFGFDPFLPVSAYTIGEGEWAIVRPPSTLGYASYAATYYLFAVFGGIALARMDSGRFWQIAGIVAAALGSVAVVLSGTRAGVLGLVAGGFVLVAASRARITARRIGAATVLAILIAIFYISPAGQKLRSRVRWSLEDSRGGARLLLWRDSLHMAAARPGIGWGPETFSSHFPRFQSRELAKALPDFYYESPHNIFIDALVSSGAPGLLCLLAVCALAYYAAKGREAAPLGAAVTASVVAHQFTVFTIPTALCLYLPIAMLIAEAAGHAKQPVVRRSWMVTLFAILLIGFGVRLTVADHLLARAAASLERGDLKSAAQLYGGSQDLQRYGPYSDLWYSRALAKLASEANSVVPGVLALQEGNAAARRAAGNADDRHNAYFNLATYCALQNDLACVETNLRQAMDWAPNWFKPHWALAKALQLAGRFDEAEKEAEIAADLAGAVYPEVAQTLTAIRSRRNK